MTVSLPLGARMCEATGRAELLLPMESSSPAAARAFARRSGCAAHAVDLLDDALLLISELVTNSILHGGPPIVLAIECDGGGMHVRVRDGSRTPPVLAARGDDAEDGRGIALVDLLSDTWGVEPVEDDYGTGKETWFELRRVA
jgi:anti-sigma regulatory factor (Ser/Thr protein kinase)